MITYTNVLTRGHLLQPSARQWLLANWDYATAPMRLLGTSLKVEKGSDKRDTYILYLQPADKVALRTLCDGAVASGCKAPCLISSGHLGMTGAQRAATKRTIWLLLAPELFKAQLLAEIDKAERRAERTGIPALFRLNGTSDLDWTDVMLQRPNSAFYDYTKVLSRVRKNATSGGLKNYHLTFSGSMYSVQSKVALRKAVERGYNVAVAFNTKGLKSDNVYVPYHLEDFDKTDLRPLDKQGAIGALKSKGSNKAERASEGYNSFFVTRDNVLEFNSILAGSHNDIIAIG